MSVGAYLVPTPQSGGTSRTPKGKIIFCIFSLPLLLLFLFAYQSIKAAGIGHPTSDLAANMLLVNKIYQQGYLLFGHYSRFNFNHPGPFSYYLFFIVENFFKLFDCTRWQSWIFTTILRNGFLISVASLLFSQYLRKKVILFDVFVFQVLFISLLNADLISIWPPHFLITTFLVFLLAITLYCRDNEFLWLTILSALILIGDYVTQGPIILPIIFIALFYNLIYKNNPLLKNNNRRNIFFISAFILLFLLPIFFDTIMNHPSNILKILQIYGSFPPTAEPSYGETLKIFANLYADNIQFSDIACFLAAFSFLVILLEHKTQQLASQLYYLSLVMLMLLCTGIFVSKHTVAPLYSYTIACFEVFYPVILALLCCISCSTITQQSFVKSFIVLILSVSILVQTEYDALASKPKASDDIATLSTYFLTHHSKPIILAQPDFTDWAEMIGILLYLSDHHIDAYTTRTNLSVVYTPERVTEQATPNYLLVKKKLCAYLSCHIVSQSEKMAIIKAPVVHPVLPQRVSAKITGNLPAIYITTAIKDVVFNEKNETAEQDIPVSIKNESKYTLFSPLFYNNGIYLSYHLFDDKMNLIANRLSLPLISNIPTGSTKKAFVTLYKPDAPGIYYAKLNLIQDGGHWLLKNELQTPIIKLIVE